jgi:hypothetical protein
LASAAVGAGIMYVALHKNLSLGAHPNEGQFIGSKSEQSIIGTRTERDRACERFGQEHRRKSGRDYSFDSIDDFYSQTLDTCLEALENQTQNWSQVVDISWGSIKPAFVEGLGATDQGLFFCDADGVDHAIIAKLRERRGLGDRVPYPEYMDDFNGGPPRSAKPAAKMFSRKDCEEFLAKELQEVR